MNNKLSKNFLLLRDNEQQGLINYLAKDLRKRELYIHFSQLYNLKKNMIREKSKQELNLSKPEKVLNAHRYGSPEDNIPKIDTSRIINHKISKPQEIKQPEKPQPQQSSRFVNISSYQKFERSPDEQQKIDAYRYRNYQNPVPPQQNVDILKEIEQKNIESIKNNLKDLKKNIKITPVSTTEKKEETQLIKKEMIPIFSNYMEKFLVQDKLKKIVENKSVALIGPANYLKNIEQGDKIEEYDIIIRFNDGIIPDKSMARNIGRRTDVWIYNFKDVSILNNLPDKMPKLIFCPYPKEVIDGYQINSQMPNCQIEFIEQHFYGQLQTVLNFEPNSALLSILVLLRQNIKNLYVSGLSFLYDGYYNNDKKNKEMQTGALTISKTERHNFISILKKVYNVNEKLFLDNTIVNLIYPNFISILNSLFIKENFNKFYSTLNYILFSPSFLQKYNSPSISTKIYVHFGKDTITSDVFEKMNLIIHSIRPRITENEVFVQNKECDYDDLDVLLGVKNRGIIYFSDNPWTALDNMIPKKNRDYILRHHCYVNGNIYGSFIKHVVNDFDINEDNRNINMLYILFTVIYYGQKMAYVSRENVVRNGLTEIINVMYKLNLIKYIK